MFWTPFFLSYMYDFPEMTGFERRELPHSLDAHLSKKISVNHIFSHILFQSGLLDPGLCVEFGSLS
jgi:hypothetical protein